MTIYYVSVRFLLEISSKIKSLGIRQFSMHYMFGLHGIDWAPIIIDMFSRNLDKLQIDVFDPRFLDKRNARILVQVIFFRIYEGRCERIS